jgi:hypothetical protein
MITHKFKAASRTTDEMTADRLKIAEAFAPVSEGGKYNRSGAQKVKEMEWEIGQLVIELMNDQVAVTDPTPLFADVVQGDIRDEYVWQEVTSAVRVVDRARGSKPQSQRLQFHEYGIKTSAKEVNIEVPLEQIASGRYNPQLIADVMAEAITRHKVAAVLDSLDAGVTAGNDRSGKAGFTRRYTGLTAANLDNAIDGLMDEGMTPTIYGRWLALNGIRNFAGWATSGSDAALREIETRGMVGSYHGSPIVTLQDKYSRRVQSHVIRYDRAYVASGQKGMIWMEKDNAFLDYVETLPAEGVYRIGTRFEYGFLVWDPFQYRIITVA